MAYREPDPYDDRDPYDVAPDPSDGDSTVDLMPAPTPNRGTDAPTFSTPGEHVGTATQPAPVSGSRFTADQWSAYRTQAEEAGAPAGWFDDFIRRNPDDPNRAAEAYSLPTDHRPYDSQSSNPYEQQQNAAADLRYRLPGQPGGAPSFGAPRPLSFATSGASGGSAWSGGTQAPQSEYGAPQFDDPASRMIEDYALNRFNQRTNPDPNSGTARFEQLARDLIDTLGGPVYSAADEAVIKGQAIDTIMRDRDQTKQRWLEEISRRGFAPSSGPALEGLQRIDEQFNTLKTTVDAQFARDAIERTRAQRTERLGVAGKLAGSEEGRLTEALTYASVPKQLSDNAFQQNLQLVGAGGNPGSMLQNALSIYQTVANNNRIDEAERNATLEGIFEYVVNLLD
jgi:hypothetical protein